MEQSGFLLPQEWQRKISEIRVLKITLKKACFSDKRRTKVHRGARGVRRELMNKPQRS
jgi:hypothetical protein